MVTCCMPEPLLHVLHYPCNTSRCTEAVLQQAAAATERDSGHLWHYPKRGEGLSDYQKACP